MFRLLNFFLGFRVIVICVLVSLGSTIRVVFLYCIVLCCLLVWLFWLNSVCVILVYRFGCVYDVFSGRLQNCVDPSVPTLLGGDFNTVFDRVLDRRGSCPFDVSRESCSLIVDCCMVDIYILYIQIVRVFRFFGLTY